MAIAGATAAAYTLAAADVGGMINHTVTATTAAGGVATADSEPVGPVVEATPLTRR